jgi:hypothetical protein
MLLTPGCKEVQTGIVEITDFKAIVIEDLIELMNRVIQNLGQVSRRAVESKFFKCPINIIYLEVVCEFYWQVVKHGKFI